jgi:Iron-containing redox enzyme
MAGVLGSPAQVKMTADLREDCRGGYRTNVTALPKPRGALSVALQSALRDLPVHPAPRLELAPESPDDAALSLWMLHELSYGGFDGVDDAAEDEPEIGRVRRRLEQDLEASLRERWPGVPDGVDLASGFFDWVAEDDGPSLARHVQTEATHEQVLDLLRVRSVYHLKEADPTTWVIPRLPTAAKAALAELQYDEYGVGDPDRLHSHLWARGMAASGLRPEHGGYVDVAPVEVLEQNNAVSMFGLRRRLRGAAVGHLAAFEATSSLPSRRMAQGLERLGFPAEIVGYYTEHIEADAVHEQVALRDVCVALVREEPSLTADVWFGAWACLELESRTARALLDSWGVAA